MKIPRGDIDGSRKKKEKNRRERATSGGGSGQDPKSGDGTGILFEE